MISPTIPRSPTKPILTKKDIFTPEIKIITTNVNTITIAVPKSGSSIIRTKKTPITRRIGKTPFLMSLIIR